MQYVREAGGALFGDNCAVCHGMRGTGGKGFPDLTAGAWLWGGEPETVAETLRVGINSTHDEARVSQMLAFGRDGTLNLPQINDVLAYVQSLGGSNETTVASPETVARGKEVFVQNCVACHGDDAKGNRDMGAPDLTDANWIYGGSIQSIHTTIYAGRQGQMPSWEQRLSTTQRKILTLYVLSLSEKGS
jgi:cytochrome c oxidase cbb3-type subunit 3